MMDKRPLQISCLHLLQPIHVLVCPLQWRHNERDGVSNHQLHNCLLNRLFKVQMKEISKLRVTGLCEGNSPVTGELPAQRASNAKNFSIWWRHHAIASADRQETNHENDAKILLKTR